MTQIFLHKLYWNAQLTLYTDVLLKLLKHDTTHLFLQDRKLHFLAKLNINTYFHGCKYIIRDTRAWLILISYVHDLYHRILNPMTFIIGSLILPDLYHRIFNPPSAIYRYSGTPLNQYNGYIVRFLVKRAFIQVPICLV